MVEKSQIQAQDRTQPSLPLAPGVPERRTHGHERHRTITLFAAFDIATGAVIGDLPAATQQRVGEIPAHHWSQVRDMLNIHLVMDDNGTHKTPSIKNSLARHPCFHVCFTPTSASWLIQVERWCIPLTEKGIRRGTHRWKRQLKQPIRPNIKLNNEDPNPFVWTKIVDDILASVERSWLRTSNS